MKRNISPYVYVGFHCNNNCIFCSEADMYHKYLKFESSNEVKKRIREIKKYYDFIRFMGREPTLRDDLIQILKFSFNYGFRDVGLTTNGRLLSYADYVKRILSTGVSQVGVSLCGPTANIHDEQTKAPGSFKETIKGIENLIKFKNRETSLLINVPLNKKNYSTLGKTIDLIIRLNANEINILFVEPLSQRSCDRNLIMPMKKLSLFVTDILKEKEALLSKFRIKILLVGFIPCSLIKKNRHLFFQCLERNPLRKRISICSQCLHKTSCDGILKSYIELYGINEFNI